MTFALEFPAWCGPDGTPLSWRHFQYGLLALGRRHIRQEIAMAEAMRAAQADREGFRDWWRDLQRLVTPLPPETRH